MANQQSRDFQRRPEERAWFCVLLVSALLWASASACGDTAEKSKDPPSPRDPVRFTRSPRNTVLNPRDIVSPVTGNRSVVNIADPCAVWDPEAQRWRVYWSFFDHEAEVAGLPATGIMGATSPSGTGFVPNSRLSVQQQGTFDSNSVETCDVVIVDDPDKPGEQLFMMFYSGSTSPVGNDDSLYLVALATSKDGVVFTPLDASQSRNNQAGVLFGPSEALGAQEVAGNYVTDPVVVVKSGTYHMWTLCIQTVPSNFGGICYHTSSDGIRWQHHGFVTGLNRAFAIQPTVYLNEQTGLFEMLVVMDTEAEEELIHDFPTNLTLRVTGFFHATSSDGKRWTQTSADRVLGENLGFPYENRGLATGADAEYRDGVVYLFYPSFTALGGSIPGLGSLLNWPLNLATRKAASSR